MLYSNPLYPCPTGLPELSPVGSKKKFRLCTLCRDTSHSEVRSNFPSGFLFLFDALARPAAGLEVQVEMKLGCIAR